MRGIRSDCRTVTSCEPSADVSVRLLGPDDVEVLVQLCREAPDFDLEGREPSVEPPGHDAATRYLSHPDVLHWVAETEGRVNGFLVCFVQYLWHEPARELMLYEIGVRASARRQGIGRALVATMEAWILEHGIEDVWVPADNPGAEAFYRTCGFERDDEQAVMMSKSLTSDRG